MPRSRLGHYILLVLVAGATVGAAATSGLRVDLPWAVPALFVCFALAYTYDVKVPGVGHMNADHLVAFPGAILLGSPATAGLLASAGYLASRLLRRGTGPITVGIWQDVFQVGLSVMAGTWVVAAGGAFAEGASPLQDLLWLAAGVWAQFALGVAIVSADHAVSGNRIWSPAFRTSLFKSLLWLTASVPYLALVMVELAEARWVPLALSLLPLAGIAWVLHLIGQMEGKNLALVEASRRQEFLLQVLASEAGSLENESFLKNLLAGLNEFIAWDHDLIFVVETPFQREPIFFSRAGMPPDPYAVKTSLEQMLEEGSLQRAEASGPGAFAPLLSGRSRQQLLVPLATREVAFGALVLERQGGEGFTDAEVQFANLAMAQVARFIQDEILKRQLLQTNRRLVHQTHYLSEILTVSNLLKIHMDPGAILEKVAGGIREGLGFQSVLISLYREEEGCFERVAQAGEDARWEEIRAVRPPSQEILGLLEDRFRVGNCYFARHSEKPPSPYDVLPANPRMAREPDDWDPMDALFVPMLNKEDRLIGIISVDEPQDGKVPSIEAFNALEIIANQAAQALESSQVHASVRHQAAVDGLTNLYNHRHFQEALARTARDHAGGARPYAILMMDLDNFKEINDRFGHVAGDAVLRGVGEAILSVTRREDVAARYGGEEFALILPGLDAATAAGVADRIRRLVEEREQRVEGVDQALGVTLSVGVSAFPEHGADHHLLLEEADAALYRAKRSGKNRVCGASRG